MSIEGELHVAVHWNGEAVERAEVRSTRPFVAPRLLSGKTVADACALVPRLFSICGRSQAVAAALACEAALGIERVPMLNEARGLLVEGEAMQEYLFRVLIDWPQMCGETPRAPIVAQARRGIAAALAPIESVSRAVSAAPEAPATGRALAGMRDAAGGAVAVALGANAADWLDRVERDGVEHWAEARDAAAAHLVAEELDARPAFGASDVALLPGIASDDLAHDLTQAMDAEGAFERAPHWHGAPAETGALARTIDTPAVAPLAGRFGRSMLVRLVARIVELAELTSGRRRGEVGQLGLGTGEGMGWVETARGLLLHRARLENGRIAAYRIVAPTEWNFHPDGALPRGLRGARFAHAGAAARCAERLVQSLDPCVAARVEVLDA